MGIRILATRGDGTVLEASDATPQGGAGARAGWERMRCRVQTAPVRPAIDPERPDRGRR